VLKRVNRSQWGAPTFIIPKKDGTARFISDFRELNKRIKRQPCLIPTIQNLLLKLEGFKCGTALDLNMGCHHIELSDASKELCTIAAQWGEHEHQRLPLGSCDSPDIFHEDIVRVKSPDTTFCAFWVPGPVALLPDSVANSPNVTKARLASSTV
jgi:hypothetical protein